MIRRAYFIVAWTLVIVATVGLIALVAGGPRESRTTWSGWRELERVDSV